MPYVKLDCGMLDSSLWNYRLDREMFITALLMAKPKHVKEPMNTFNQSGRPDPFVVPPGENYGFVEASGSGIARRALLYGVEDEEAARAMDVESYDWEDALRALASPDKESRTPDFEGRRMVRVDGGFIILNYGLYREKDSSTDRVRRHRLKKKSETPEAECNVPHVTETLQEPGNGDETQAEAEAEAKIDSTYDLRLRINEWFARRESTKWNDDEIKALKKLLPISEEDMEDMAKRRKMKDEFHRKSILTLLRNWGSELDKYRKSKMDYERNIIRLQ